MAQLSTTFNCFLILKIQTLIPKGEIHVAAAAISVYILYFHPL